MSIEQKVCWTATCDQFGEGEWDQIFYLDRASLEESIVSSDWVIDDDGKIMCFDCCIKNINAEADAEEIPAS